MFTKLQEHEEVVLKMSQIIGQLLFKLKAKQLHLKYKEEFLEFYKFICGHKTDKVREHAAFNLPCFNSIYRHCCLPPAQTKGAIARQKTGISNTKSQDEDEESKD